MVTILATDHADIKFLKNRLNYLIHIENYEHAAVIRDWIKELYKHHHNDNKIQKRSIKSK